MDLSLCGPNLKCNLRVTRSRPNFLTSRGRSLIAWLAEVRVMKSPTSNIQLGSKASGGDGGELPAVLGGEHGVLAGNPEPGGELVPPCRS